MNPSGESIAVAIALVAAMAAYALLAGADLGAGIWDALAGGRDRGAETREQIRQSVGPVWEANNVWIIFGLVIFWTGFPAAFAAAMTALFVPIALSLLGIVLRGSGFAFREQVTGPRAQMLATAVFAGSSVMAPFFLGAAVGAVATGQVRTDTVGNVTRAWTGPVPLVTGALFTVTCAYIGAVYLVRDCRRRGHEPLARYFARRGVAAGLVAGALAALNLVLLHRDGQYVFDRLHHTAWPLVVISVAAGLLALVMIVAGRTRLVRPVAATAVAAVVGAWAWAQYPYLLPRSLTLARASATSTALSAQLVVVGAAVVLVGPSFVYLYWLQQRDELEDTAASSVQLRRAVAAQQHAQGVESGSGAGHQTPAFEGARSHRVVTAVIIAAAGMDLVREAVARARRLRDGRGRGP